MTDSRRIQTSLPALAVTPDRPAPQAVSRSAAPADLDSEDTACPRCAESRDLAKVKGCVKCLKCGFKFDCNGW